MMMSLFQFSPVSTLALPVVDSIKADIVAWGVVFIGVALTLYAYHQIEALVAQRETAREDDEAREESRERFAELEAQGVEPDYDSDFRIRED